MDDNNPPLLLASLHLFLLGSFFRRKKKENKHSLVKLGGVGFFPFKNPSLRFTVHPFFPLYVLKEQPPS